MIEISSHNNTPKDGPFKWEEEGRNVFVGRHHMLEGYSAKVHEDVILGFNSGPSIVREGTKYLEIHFDVKARDIYDGELRKVIKVMKKGAEEMMDLSDAFEKNKLKKVDLIVGTTNTRMAKLAVRKLGFRYYDDKVPETKNMVEGATIYISREDLKSKAEELRMTRKKLKIAQRR